MSDEKPKGKIFLSYARRDDERFVFKLFKDLQRLNFAPWFDRENMTNDGAPFTQAIGDAIRASQRFLLVVGPRSVNSPYCKGEWSLALSLCIPVVPLLRLGDNPDIPPEVGKWHAIDCRESRPYADMLNELHRILQDPVRPLATIGTTPRLPEKYVPRPQYLNPLKESIRSGDPLDPLTSGQEAAALVGIGGIGKTTIASALCHDCEVRRTFDQLFWIEVGPKQNTQKKRKKKAAALMHAVAGGADADYAKFRRARRSFASALSNRKTLIVLDDVWDYKLAQAFQFAGVDCRLLLTTRQKRIVDILGARAQQVDKLTGDEALELLRTFRNDLDEADADAVIGKLDGHALALALAGRWLMKNPGKTGADLLHRLEQRQDFRDLKLDETDKNLNLELSLRLSYDDLNPAAQGHFRALGVLALASSVDAGALQALWDIDDKLDAEDGITVLTDAGLLVRDEDNRYSQHGLLRAYARALLDKQGETDAAFARYADHTIEQTEAFSILPLEKWGELDPLLPHVYEVGDTLVKQWQSVGTPDNALVERTGTFALNLINRVFDTSSRSLIIQFVQLARLKKSKRLDQQIYNSVIKTLHITKKQSADKHLNSNEREKSMDIAWGLTHLVRDLVIEFWGKRMLNTLGCPLKKSNCKHLIDGDRSPANYQLIASTLAQAFIKPRHDKTLVGVTAKRVDNIMYKSLKASYTKRVRFVEALAESPNKKKVARWILKLYRRETKKEQPDQFLIKSFVDAFGTLEKYPTEDEIRSLLNKDGLADNLRRSARSLGHKMTGKPEYEEEPYTDDEIRSELVSEAPDLPGEPSDWKRIEAIAEIIKYQKNESPEVIDKMFLVLHTHLHEGARMPIIEALGEVGDQSVFDRLLKLIEFRETRRETSVPCRLKILDMLDKLYSRLSSESRFSLDIADVVSRIQTIANSDYDRGVRNRAQSLLNNIDQTQQAKD